VHTAVRAARLAQAPPAIRVRPSRVGTAARSRAAERLAAISSHITDGVAHHRHAVLSRRRSSSVATDPARHGAHALRRGDAFAIWCLRVPPICCLQCQTKRMRGKHEGQRRNDAKRGA
jgi:hypothetical protein